ncbi:DNA polymerase III subunit beta [Halolactibacillus alkaliphilus]|uniref:Beta sliding clamp n=1 Tax=Halolactibacillus alkaliphilus TaxID=442899 RepID=A0A511X0E6_9BACI|nr:DNA polymerase III subunit beta [Halolactibacillus alkaliphilus]GEN56405.1 DNA polymerase III subunit beta [Halolactibacillus alkaliphilus]GGN64594.1 DNA polymerase III subunit beta [Halolactibacillus alkaliphilus]SFO60771.1 DNA polymerase-3 subunit beta [Halolactibacillus alkaliphilus]
MKFIIQRELLLESLQHVMKAISPRVAVPILTGIKIEALPTGIKLTGSDSDISIESFIPKEEDGLVHVEDIETGSIVVQAKYFPEIIRKLPLKTVEISTDDNYQMTVVSGGSEFHLNGQDAMEYPQLPVLHTDNSFEIKHDVMKEMIKQTVFAVSTVETRPILTGVNMKIDNGEMTFVATDSHRLASRSVKLAEDFVHIQFNNIVIPGKSLAELNKIIDESDDSLTISVADNQILFQTKNLYFLSRLLDGKYPETDRLIPEVSKTSVKVKTKTLLQAIDRASLLAKENRNNVVKLETRDNALQISSNTPEVGQVTEDVITDHIDGEQLKISFSAKYMIDALRIIEEDNVIVHFTGAMRPFILYPENNDHILQLILPVRTY